MYWSVCREFAVDIQALDEEYVAFHHGSGCTHRLSTEAGKVFVEIRRNLVAVDIEGLISEPCLKGMVPEQLQAILQDLAALSLIIVSESP